jgi:hypothetical protein
MVTETKHRNWFIKHWIISIFLGIIILGIVVSMFNTGSDTSSKKSGLSMVDDSKASATEDQTPQKSSSKIKTIGEIWITVENWDSDSDVDGLHFYLSPEDSEGLIVKTDGTLNIKLWKLECTEENEYIGCVKSACTKKDKDLIETWSIPLTKSDFSILTGAEIKAEYKEYNPLTSASSSDKIFEEQGCTEVTFIDSTGNSFSSLEDMVFLSGT